MQEQTRAIELAVFANNRLLNAILRDASLLEEVDRDVFISKSSSSIYDAIEALVKDGAADPSKPFHLTPEQVYEEAANRDSSVTSSLIKSIFQLVDEKPSTVVDMIRHLDNAKKVLRTTSLLKKALSDAESGPMTEELAKKISETISSAEAELVSSGFDDIKKVYTAEQWIDKYLEETKDRRNGRQYPYGYKVLDELIIEGATPGDGLVLCSSTGAGKSTACLNIIDSFLDQSVPCIFFSSEMSLTSIMDRLLAKKIGIPFKDLVAPSAPSDFDDARRQIEEFRAEFVKNDLFRFSADPKPSIGDIGKAVKKFQLEIGRRYCVVFIDLLSMVKEFADGKEGTNFAQQIELALNKLNALAKELMFHWIGTVQLNRTVESEKINSVADLKKTKPTRASLKNSNAYLERARTTIGLWRPLFFAKECLDPSEYEDMPDIVSFSVLKSNSNDIQERRALFVPETFTMIPTEDTNLGVE